MSKRNQFEKVKADSLDVSPFRMIGREWMLITAQKDGKVNTMTASWGGLGVFCGSDVAFIVVRESRYTKEFLDAADAFSLSFLEHQQYEKELSYLGSVSGRDEEKIGKAGLEILYQDGVPFIGQAERVILCRKMFRQRMEPDNFEQRELLKTYYPKGDYHFLYIGAVREILQRADS